MVPTRLLLEGADLAELMVHVRAEFGPNARVVRAERVRSGGVAGFFARERYELTIDVPDESAVPPPSLRSRRAGLLGISGISGTSGGPGGSGGSTGAAAGPVGLEAMLAAADAADERPDGTVLASSAAGTGGPGATVAPVGPRVSTGQEAFASVLERMRQLTGGVVEDHQLEVPPPVPAAPPAPAAPAAPALAVGPPVASASSVASADRAFEPLAPPAAVRSAVPETAAATPPVPVPVRPAGPGVPRDVLEELGVPAALLAAAGPGPVELSRLLSTVPTAPPVPRDPGTVLVVVGPPEDAVRVADLLALRSGETGTTVVHAGDVEPTSGHGRRLTTTAAAERWRARAGDADEMTVVALGVRPGRSRETAGADLLAALAPDQVWAAVDARSNVRDCVRWLGVIGSLRPIDALAVSGLFDTSEPGSVLGLGVPVAWIDGVPASRVAWAAALGEHLPEGTVWG